MPDSTIGGDDPEHQLSRQEKDRLERKLREQARQHLRQRRVRERQELLDRAVNISRRESRRAQHH